MIKLKSLFRRGQSGNPSSTGSSKQIHQVSPSHSVEVKPSASTSSLDKIAANNTGSASADLGATRKLSKTHKQSSKDKLNDLLRVSSKEKVFDDKKELKKQQKHSQKQMQQFAQQSSSIHQPPAASSSRQSPDQRLDDQRPPEHLHSKHFDSTAFSGLQDVRFLTFFPPTDQVKIGNWLV